MSYDYDQRRETPVPDGIVVTERLDRCWTTTVHQAGQLDGWAVESATVLEAVERHRVACLMARQSAKHQECLN